MDDSSPIGNRVSATRHSARLPNAQERQNIVDPRGKFNKTNRRNLTNFKIQKCKCLFNRNIKSPLNIKIQNNDTQHNEIREAEYYYAEC